MFAHGLRWRHGRLRHFAAALAASQVCTVPSLGHRVATARALREVYSPGFAFPAWSLEELLRP